MRITFLNLADYRQYHNLSSGPIGLAYLASAAKAHFPDVEISIEVDPDRVITSKPDIVGIRAFTETYSQSIEAAHHIRRYLGKEVPIWLGGPHINALPSTLAPIFELGVVGEGEQTFVELLALAYQQRLTPDYLKSIQGVVYWDEGKRVITPARETLMELDQILPPDRSIMKTWWPPQQSVINWPQPIYTSRGCPFKCVFCIYSMETQKVRYHSVDRVVSEIEDILRHNPGQETVSIHDDLFALSKKRLYELTQGIRAAKLHKKVGFVCMAKASVFNDEMALLMRDMNVSIVTFGLESGVQRQLSYLKGPRNKVEENVRAIDICARHGIRMGGYFIIGTPTETYSELQQAYWFIRGHYPPMSMAGVFRLTPFPGTKFWEEAVERGIVKNDLEDWRPFNYLDMDKRDYLFFNENYSLETFKDAYTHFCSIMDRNNLGISMEDHENRLVSYQEPVYKQVLQGLSQGQKVLEVSGFTRMTVSSVLEDLDLELQITRIKPWEFDSTHLTDSYDLIICNFALEQRPENPQLLLKALSQALSVGGRLLSFIYNPCHESVVMRLLNGSWDKELWGFRPFDMYTFLTPKQLEKIVQNEGLSLESITPLRKELYSERENAVQPHVQQTLELLQTHIGGPVLSTYREFAYTILTNPKEIPSSHGRYTEKAGESGQGRDLAYETTRPRTE
jgi:anaerobic magnesium-protoporphyrin IX monomethyl ester cyclase